MSRCKILHTFSSVQDFAPDSGILAPTLIYFDANIDIATRWQEKKKMKELARIREKVNAVECAVLVDCVRIGTDISQGDGFVHYMVTARAKSGRYITWRAIDRKENGTSDLVLCGGRYDIVGIQNAVADMYDRARDALAGAHWEDMPQEAI